jgi:predicted phage tail protein
MSRRRRPTIAIRFTVGGFRKKMIENWKRTQKAQRGTQEAQEVRKRPIKRRAKRNKKILCG